MDLIAAGDHQNFVEKSPELFSVRNDLLRTKSGVPEQMGIFIGLKASKFFANIIFRFNLFFLREIHLHIALRIPA